jgi:hypothetical protein
VTCIWSFLDGTAIHNISLTSACWPCLFLIGQKCTYGIGMVLFQKPPLTLKFTPAFGLKRFQVHKYETRLCSLQSIRIVASCTRTRLMRLNMCRRRSWRSRILGRWLARLSWSSRWFRPPLRWINLASSSRWLVGRWHWRIWIVHWRRHWVHSVLTTGFWVLRVEDVWVLIWGVVHSPLLSVEQPLHNVSPCQNYQVVQELTRWYARGCRPLFIRLFACQYPILM